MTTLLVGKIKVLGYQLKFWDARSGEIVQIQSNVNLLHNKMCALLFILFPFMSPPFFSRGRKVRKIWTLLKIDVGSNKTNYMHC